MIRQTRRMTPKRNPECLGSTRGSRVGFGGSPKHSFQRLRSSTKALDRWCLQKFQNFRRKGLKNFTQYFSERPEMTPMMEIKEGQNNKT